MSELCKGECGGKAVYHGWCKVKWKSGNRFGVACPQIEQKRGRSISKFRLEESKNEKNPMQNPIICAKNHSQERNKKCSITLKKKGEMNLLPQQTESKELKEKRRKNVSIALNRLWIAGKHPIQLESHEKRKKRFEKISKTLRLLGEQGKLPVQNMSEVQKRQIAKKVSKSLIEGIKSGKIKLSPSWKKVPYGKLNLRSYWEGEVAEFLDKNKLDWEYETKKIPYWDTERKREAVTIPDFFIPSKNLIIEVKSNAEFKTQKTKDKMDGIKSKGFDVFLVGKKEINLIKNNKFLDILNGVKNEKN
ncbi:MAG: hypothetical protein NTX24_03090 [Candidatus Pacearchaeota archaeon]|nr:hypothetical protein [Candidatus Pacearchaeota archaeon]